MERKGKVSRKTRETEIDLEINLDGSGKALIETSLPFLNHMLETMARHGLFDITLKARGDINVDPHHTVEDIGITLVKGFKEALSDKRGIKRFVAIVLLILGGFYLLVSIGVIPTKIAFFGEKKRAGLNSIYRFLSLLLIFRNPEALVR